MSRLELNTAENPWVFELIPTDENGANVDLTGAQLEFPIANRGITVATPSTSDGYIGIVDSTDDLGNPVKAVRITVPRSILNPDFIAAGQAFNGPIGQRKLTGDLLRLNGSAIEWNGRVEFDLIIGAGPWQLS